ncbi:MAG: exopolyphosphatase [Acidobacteria bacterium]|nr:exopolyphosphatase [Acidobacteriota bacterium]
MANEPDPGRELVSVLDMGASAIRLVVAEVARGAPPRIVEEASRGVQLGRDPFSGRTIRPKTIDAALAALEGFRAIMDGYGVRHVRAVATSAVREARNGDTFLDRIEGRTGIAFEVINEAEESRLIFLAVRHALRRHAAFKGARTLLAEVGGGSTSLTLLRRGEPTRSGVYALGSVRLRQQLDLRRHALDVQVALLKRYVANILDEIRLEIPLHRVTHAIVLGGDVRFAASQMDGGWAGPDEGTREIARDRFLAFCDEVERLDAEGIADRFRLPVVEAETLGPALLINRLLLSETPARRLVVSDASLRMGVLLDIASDGGSSPGDLERQVLASAESVGRRYRFDSDHGHQVARLATRLFDELRDEHRLPDRKRLLLQVAAMLHDVGVYLSLRAHHKHSQYILDASQIFGLSRDETAVVANIARYHRRALPQDTHLPYVALDREDRLVVNKLGAILRLANALDAEHGGKVSDLRVVREGGSWAVELDGAGDLTMELLSGTARADMFVETFGRPLAVRRRPVTT